MELLQQKNIPSYLLWVCNAATGKRPCQRASSTATPCARGPFSCSQRARAGACMRARTSTTSSRCRASRCAARCLICISGTSQSAEKPSAWLVTTSGGWWRLGRVMMNMRHLRVSWSAALAAVFVNCRSLTVIAACNCRQYCCRPCLRGGTFTRGSTVAVQSKLETLWLPGGCTIVESDLLNTILAVRHIAKQMLKSHSGMLTPRKFSFCAYMQL